MASEKVKNCTTQLKLSSVFLNSLYSQRKVVYIVPNVGLLFTTLSLVIFNLIVIS